MISCPNKRLKAWKDLEAIYGENKAYGLWNKYEGYPPAYLYEIKESKESLTDNKIILDELLGTLRLRFGIPYKFDENQKTTIGVEFCTKNMIIDNK